MSTYTRRHFRRLATLRCRQEQQRIAVGPGNAGRSPCLFDSCDAARMARRYCVRCNSTAAAAGGAAITQCAS